MHKVKPAILAYKIFHDCTPPFLGHILPKKTSPIHHLRTTKTVTVNTYFMKKSMAAELLLCEISSPRISQRRPCNVKNYTRMASKSDKLRNLDFQAESSQTMTHNNDNDFL